jgi:hypothetical protein
VCTVESGLRRREKRIRSRRGIDHLLAVGRSEGTAGSAAGAGVTSGTASATRVACMLGLPQLKRRIRAFAIGGGIACQLLWAMG